MEKGKDKSTASYEGMGVNAAAFAMRDPYYYDMARIAIRTVERLLTSRYKIAIDIGAGTGMSTMKLLELNIFSKIYAVEPDGSMLHFLRLNTMGNPRVEVVKGKAEELSSLISGKVDFILASEVAPLFNVPGKSQIPVAFQQIAKVLKKGGIFAATLGPSNYNFNLRISDHRSGKVEEGDIMTELSHPLYQKAHEIAMEIVRERYQDFDLENLWPTPKARMDYSLLRIRCEEAGLRLNEIAEELSEISGKRVLEFIRNAWSVWMRWGKLSTFSPEEKRAFMAEVLQRLCNEPDFKWLENKTAYHPVGVIIAEKV